MKKHLFPLLSTIAFSLILVFPLRAADRTWVVGSGTWNTATNWSNNTRPSGADAAMFGYGSLLSGTVTVNDAATFPTGSPQTLALAKGNWIFNLALSNSSAKVFGYTPLTPAHDPSTLIFGDGVGTGPNVSFNGTATDGTAAKIGFSSFVLGANGSSNNQIGTGANSTVIFNNVQFVNPLKTITIGSSAGGTNNVFRIGAESIFAGKTFTDIALNAGGGITNNNRFDLDGAAAGSTGGIVVDGFYDATDPSNIVQSGNQFRIRNGGQLTLSGGRPQPLGTEGIYVGAGSEFRVDTGGSAVLSVSNLLLTVAEHGSFNLDNGQITTGGAEVLGPIIGVSGMATLQNGSVLQSSSLTVDTTGRLNVESSTLNGGSLNVSGGEAKFLNNAQFTNAGNITISNGGHLLVDGSTIEGNGTNQLTTSGGTMEIRNNSQVRAYYLFGSGAEITVEEGSSVYFDKWTTGSLSVKGTAIWGTGEKNGPHPTANDSHMEATITAGTTLLLGGGNYDLDGEEKIGSGSSAVRVSKAGRFRVESGAVLGGSGNIGGNPNFSGDANHPDYSNQTFVEVRGGALQPGTKDAAGTLVFSDGVSFLNSSSAITFSVFGVGAGEYDQILTSSISLLNGGSMVVKLELAPNLADFLATLTPEEVAEYLVPGETVFQFFGDLSGLARSIPSGFTFDFGASSGQLAAYGLGWDTSNFGSTGAVGIMAVPEPSTYALIGIGLAVVLLRMRKRGVRVA